MRPVLHGDVVAAARALYAVPSPARAGLLERLMCAARWADRYRRRTGSVHPDWGDGSLMCAALAKAPPPEPPLSDRDYCRCLAMVFDALVDAGGSLAS